MIQRRRMLDVALTIDAATSLDKAGSAVAVIDVLRATSTIAKAIASGADAVFPSAGIEAAKAMALELSPALLCGERLGIKPDGFDLGNSPSEYTEATVKGRRIVLATTNGTKALARYSEAGALYAAGFLNATAVAERLMSSGLDVILVCAGQDGRFGAEDAICAGLIAEKLSKAGFPMTDPGWAAVTLWRACAHDVEGSVRQCDHAVYLAEEGFGDDIAYCSKVDELDVVPEAGILAGRPALRRA